MTWQPQPFWRCDFLDLNKSSENEGGLLLFGFLFFKKHVKTATAT